MITAQIDKKSPPDLEALRVALSENVKGASLDDHRAWTQRLSVVGRTLVLATLATLGLVIAAAGFAIAFATRGAMISNREIIEVLHFVGASESYIARQFQIHFLWIGIKGGIIGGIAAITLFLALHIAARHWASSPNGAEMIALFGTFSLSLNAIIAVMAIALLMALVAAFVSRVTANRTIRGLD
jgi:cell division transport system permease protein